MSSSLHTAFRRAGVVQGPVKPLNKVFRRADEAQQPVKPLNISGIFPDYPQLNFSSDCALYGQWLASFILPNPSAPNESYAGSVDLSRVYFIKALPDDWHIAGEDNLTYSEITGLIMEWYATNLYNYLDDDDVFQAHPDFVPSLIDDPRENCPADYCKAIASTGNPDVSGIGVLSSYYIEAVLATFYLTAFTLWNVRRHYEVKKTKRSSPSAPHIYRSFTGFNTWGGRVIDAFRGSLDEFFGNALLVAMSMLIAAMYTATEKAKKRGEQDVNNQNFPTGSAFYDIALSLIASSFSVFPLMTIYAIMRHPQTGEEGANRKWARRFALFVVWVLSIAEIFLAPRGEMDYDERHDVDQDSIFCDLRGGTRYWTSIKASQFLVIGVPLLWFVITIFLGTGFWIPGVAEFKWVRRWRGCWRLLVAWVNLAVMWGILVYFNILRDGIIDNAGDVDNDNAWMFGQILAVTIWVPTIGEFLWILIFGMEDGLSSHMPPGFKAVRRHPPGYHPEVNPQGYAAVDGAGGGKAAGHEDGQSPPSTPPHPIDHGETGGQRPGPTAAATFQSTATQDTLANETAPTGYYLGPTGSWNGKEWKENKSPWNHFRNSDW